MSKTSSYESNVTPSNKKSLLTVCFVNPSLTRDKFDINTQQPKKAHKSLDILPPDALSGRNSTENNKRGRDKSIRTGEIPLLQLDVPSRETNGENGSKKLLKRPFPTLPFLPNPLDK